MPKDAKLTILNVAYPFAPVGPDAVGGAEQVLAQLDLALTQAGHCSIVIASEGSLVSGRLLPIPSFQGSITDTLREQVWTQMRTKITEALMRWPIDVVHLHGVDFFHYLPAYSVPVLATLHLPISFYPSEIFQIARPRTFLHCVSLSQRRSCPAHAKLLPDISNGTELILQRHAKRHFAFALGRICPEKGFHIALQAAKEADFPCLLAGKVFPYPDHQKNFDCEIKPRLDEKRCFIGPVGLKRKRRFLSAAQCLLVPSLVAETSSLVTMEALSCGTPVIAFPTGALPDLIEHGKTGFLVSSVHEMAQAIHAASSLDPAICRQTGVTRFSLSRMSEAYFSAYRLCQT